MSKHMPEPVIFMNMCMICRGDEVVALDKVSDDYAGTTFPGGHVEAGETFHDAIIREVYEETGLAIANPVLRGVYHWHWEGIHNIVYLYQTSEFEGQLKSSGEGTVYWTTRSDFEKKNLAVGMQRVLQIMDRDGVTECYVEIAEDESVTARMM